MKHKQYNDTKMHIPFNFFPQSLGKIILKVITVAATTAITVYIYWLFEMQNEVRIQSEKEKRQIIPYKAVLEVKKIYS